MSLSTCQKNFVNGITAVFILFWFLLGEKGINSFVYFLLNYLQNIAISGQIQCIQVCCNVLLE